MSWNKLAPIQKTTGRPMASASIVVNKDGVPKISLILSSSLRDEFGSPGKADVCAGEGEDAGSLLLEFKEDGAFDVKGFVHGGARLFIPIPPDWPTRPAANEPCAVVEKKGGGGELLAPGEHAFLVIRLPIAAWRQVIDARINAARQTATSPAATTRAATPAVRDNRLDAVEYLTGKGFKISRLAEGRFAVNGDTMTFAGVLKLVNDHRKAADLDPLAHAQVW